jgi:hypothetical protein
MRSSDLVNILLKAAEVSYRTDFVVIGSSAIHGTIENPSIDAVMRTPDADFYPVVALPPQLWESLMIELGQESDYHAETGCYLEIVSSNLARFPDGWEQRAITKRIGSINVKGEAKEVNAIFPEIHDLTVSKVAIRRPKDLDFLQGVVNLGLVDEAVLLTRWATVPRVNADGIKLGVSTIEEAFVLHRAQQRVMD